MDRIKTFFRTSDWESVGVAAFYGYFAINILMKALAYDHGDNIIQIFLYLCHELLGDQDCDHTLHAP